jgi:flagellar biosynthesis GTPase FlhF
MLPTGVGLKDEMPRVMEYFSDCELVLVDTPGVDGTAPIPAVVRYLATLDEVSSTIIVPATASPRYIAALSSMAQELKISRVAISQVDMAFSIGNALNALMALSKPLAFITDGAEVAGHAHPANPEMLVDLLMRDIH